MNIKYKITEYFDNNNLFDNEISTGLKIKNDSNTLYIEGSSKDLIELADILVSISASKDKNPHIHIDDLTLINKESEIKEIIIEKKQLKGE